jgi:hypothetical protein
MLLDASRHQVDPEITARELDRALRRSRELQRKLTAVSRRFSHLSPDPCNDKRCLAFCSRYVAMF